MREILLIAGVYLVFYLIAFLVDAIKSFFKNIRKYNQADEKIREAQKIVQQINESLKKLEVDKGRLEEDRGAFDILVKEKTMGFPWLAAAIGDYFSLKTDKIAEYLERKPHPAQKSAELVRGEARRRRIAEKQARVSRYLLEYYENLFPWLVDFKGEDLDDLVRRSFDKQVEVDEELDPVSFWLAPGEFQKLSPAERNQRALDRYWTRKKAKWEIGRDYERFIGYLLEKDGYSVVYHGIEEGFYDLGRDLLAQKGDEIIVVQCKHWSQEKTIHEKHICQFKGTVLKYSLEEPGKRIIGRFITSTKLSDVAREFAKALDIEVQEQRTLDDYPVIKCNISKRTREKIYHLPFDQQYDRAIIEEEKSECYARTVAEAETLGFRRAFKWRGDKQSV